ncbi:MAG: hypothetical protein CMJ18_19305 [Phycisphaeraceae bacterium]|nr:hypothetical protein [Phycisphaeraceae bacterium]
MEPHPEHEYDSRENDLYQFIVNFRQWWDRNWKIATTMIVAIGLAVAIFMIRSRNARSGHERDWSAVASATEPTRLHEISRLVGNAESRNLARLRAADLWARKAALPPGDDETEAAQETPEQLLAQAEESYQAVRDDSVHDLFKLNAMLGLAAIAESRQEWDKAADLYEEIRTKAEAGRYASHGDQAAARLEMLPRLREPLTFAPEPPATDEPSDGDAPTGDASSDTGTDAPDDGGTTADGAGAAAASP